MAYRGAGLTNKKTNTLWILPPHST